MRLGPADAEIAKRITTDPSFRGPSGKFDRTRFEQVIRQAGFTESRFIEHQRRAICSKQIAQSVDRRHQSAYSRHDHNQSDTRTKGGASDMLLSVPLRAARFRHRRRRNSANTSRNAKPCSAAPEYRKVTLLPLAPADLAKAGTVTDADAKGYFEQRKASYGKPEKRELRQIDLPNAEDAAAAYDRITKGATFDDIAKERGVK